jgi:hypothetical protein
MVAISGLAVGRRIGAEGARDSARRAAKSIDDLATRAEKRFDLPIATVATSRDPAPRHDESSDADHQ